MNPCDRPLVVMGIDPGTAKCGIAVVSTIKGTILRKVVPTSEIGPTVLDLFGQFAPDVTAIGNGTHSAAIINTVEISLSSLNADATLVIVEESHTSEAARKQAIIEEKPVGLRKFLPRALRSPIAAYDDIVAEILACRWIAKQAARQEE